MHHRLSLLLGLLLALATSAPAILHAADPVAASADTCIQDINQWLNRERFTYHSVLFGVRNAKSDPVGSTRVDQQGVLWIKSNTNRWTSPPLARRTDAQMDRTTAFDPLSVISKSSSSSPAVRSGIFETQQATTSELIPALLQSFRAFECRVETVCESAERALYLAAESDSSVSTTPGKGVPGCRMGLAPVDPLPVSCRPTLLTILPDLLQARGYCEPAKEELLRFEEQELAFLVHYDAAHRSLRQFGGYLEPLYEIVRFPFLTPLRETAQFMNIWNRIPCFEPYCSQERASSSSKSIPKSKN
ncbi:MAG: hypothetical protein WCS85_05160 [Candidatus Peribacteraceae bacterium]